MNVSGLQALQIIEEALEVFPDLQVEIQVNHDPKAESCATLFLPPLKSQNSMPFTPNIYGPHGCIFSQN